MSVQSTVVNSFVILFVCESGAGKCHQLPKRSTQCSTLHLCNR